MIDDAWREVMRDADRLRPISLSELFERDPARFERFSQRDGDLLVDFSKEKVDEDALAALIALAQAAGVESHRDVMFRGEKVNRTEDRAALHMALRSGAGERVVVDGEDVMPAVLEMQERFLGFAEDVRAARITAISGEAFTDVVNLGIGGSDLGPAMAVQALAPFHDGPRVHFVSNVDGAHLADTIKNLDPARTLVIVASKTFTTQETMTNARSARTWLEAALGAHAPAHMAAVSTNLAATRDFGIEDAHVFGFWDWVGGRYSLWSAIGLPLAIAVGAARFRELLAGGRAMDTHFRTAPLADNLPVLLALIGIWRRNAMGWPSVAVIPYAERLARFPAYLQQLEMESNGKRVRLDGSAVTHPTSPIIWGEPGTNAQHSFFQLIHQGTDIVPVDFLIGARPSEEIGTHHAQLLANALAQSAALAFGRGEAEVRADMQEEGASAAEIDRLAPHRSFPGDRPSTTILYRQLDPFTLGRLIALYEHKVFVQGAIWGIDSFDQWGVELGKKVAISVLPALEDPDGALTGFDGSTAGLIAAARNMRKP